MHGWFVVFCVICAGDDLSPSGPSVILRVLWFDSRDIRGLRARREWSPHPAQAIGARRAPARPGTNEGGLGCSRVARAAIVAGRLRVSRRSPH